MPQLHPHYVYPVGMPIRCGTYPLDSRNTTLTMSASFLAISTHSASESNRTVNRDYSELAHTWLRSLPSHHQVHRRLGKHLLLHAVPERGKVDAFEQGLALSEQDRRDGEMYLVE